MSEIFQELLKSSPYAIIELFELHLDQTLHGSSEVVRFHAGVNQTAGAGSIYWQTNPYQPLPIEAEGFEYNGTGQLPRPRIRVSNLLGSISALLLGVNEITPGNDLTGAQVVRIRTLSRFLDPANFPNNVNPYGTPDPTAEMPREIYYVDRKSAENREVVEFELASVFDLAGIRAPKRQVIANICQWKYRSAECGYTGTTYFDENDTPLSLAPAPNYSNTFDTLNFGNNLVSPNAMVSANGWYKAVMQADGNLVVYSKNGTAVWSTNTVTGTGNYRLRNQVDGDLRISNLDTGVYTWATNTANAAVGVTSVAFIPDASGAGSISWVPTDISTGRAATYGWELFGNCPGSGNPTATRTFYSPTTISPGRFITLIFTGVSVALPVDHYSGLAYRWDLQTMTISSSGGFWDLNETFNATVNVSSGNPFKNTPYGTLTTVGPQIQITGTQGYGQNKLVMQNDGNLVLYNSANAVLWASGYYTNQEPLIASGSGDPAKDVCGKRISSCKKRFGDYGNLPFGSYPSAGTFYG